MDLFQRKTYVFGVLLQFMVIDGVRAEWVQHHAMRVESEGGYVACLACHDGVVASSVSPCLATVCFFRGPHPVARPYPPADKADQFTHLGEAQGKGIRFLDGRMDCISCHDLYNAGRYHLRLPAADSRLCFACHRK